MFGQPSHLYVPFEHAQALRQGVGSIAEHLISSAASHEDAISLFSELRKIFEITLSTSAKRWNAQHDRLRGLPVELWRPCLTSLSTADKCNLLQVCSFWRETIARDPTLWQDVDVLDRPHDLAAVLRRSNQLPVQVAVSVRTNEELRKTNHVLRMHAHRLRRLHITFKPESPAVGFPSERMLDFAAPQLRELELHSTLGESVALMPGLFNYNLGQLRSVCLHGVGLPRYCPALANVTAASIQGACPGLRYIFLIMPALEHLELINVHGQAGETLPELGRAPRVTHVRLRDSRLAFSDLEGLGYLRAVQLHVTCTDGITLAAAAAAHFATAPDLAESTLVVDHSGAAELRVQRAQGHTSAFAAAPLSFSELQPSLSAFRGISRLVLPLHLSVTECTWATRYMCPLLPADVEFPRLTHLAIHGVPWSLTSCGLLDPAIERGVVVAPLLVRLELTARGIPFGVRVGDLVTFVEEHLKLAEGSDLEVVIDTVLVTLSDKLMASTTSYKNVCGLLHDLNKMLEVALCNSARKLNATHDRMRALPVELWRPCLESLPTADKCNLSRVCSFWRETFPRDAPLWARIDVTDQPLDLASLLRLSNQLPVAVVVAADTSEELRNTNRVLRWHAHRLLRLKLSFTGESLNAGFPFLDFATPQLRELELRCTSEASEEPFILPQTLFDGKAGQLHSVSLHGLGLPAYCPALASVTSASIHRSWPGLRHLFFIMPALERLDLVHVLGHGNQVLPELGRGRKLEHLRICDSRLVFSELDLLGYLRAAHLHITSEDGIALVAAAAAHFTNAPDSEPTLVISHTGATELRVRRAQHRVAIFAADPLSFSEIRTSFVAFRNITRLVLPVHFSATDYTATRARVSPLLSGDVELPRLTYLAIHGAPSSSRGCGLLDPGVVCGVIGAPLLMKLELTARGKPFCVRAGDLAVFVEQHLKLATCSHLEVVIDTASGVRLEYVQGSKDISRLRRCIGTLIS